MTQGVKPGAADVYRSVFSCVGMVWREEGARGLARGLATRVAFASIFNAVGLPLFEHGKVWSARAVLAKRRRRRRVATEALLAARAQ